MSTLVRPIDDHPLPTDPDAARDLLEENPEFRDRDAPNPDELHTDYVTVLSETHHWHVFRVDIYGFTGRVYVWNNQLGEGFVMPDQEGEFDLLAEAVAGAIEVGFDSELEHEPIEAED